MSKTYINKPMIIKAQGSKHLKFISNASNLDGYLNKATLLGGTNTEIKDNTYMIKMQDQSIIISSNQLALPSKSTLIFESSKFDTLDLTELDTSEVDEAYGLFYRIRMKEIIGLDKVDLSNLESTTNTFYRSTLNNLDLSTVKLSKLRNTVSMFYGCRIGRLDISNLNFEKLNDCSRMFEESEIDTLVLNNLNIDNLGKIHKIFRFNKIKNIEAPESLSKKADYILSKSIY